MITQINFSKKSLVMASAGQALVSFSIQIGFVLILFAYYGYRPNPKIFYLPLAILPLVLLTLGLGFILSLLNGIVRDAGNIMSLLLTFFMFLTPILYAKPDTGMLALMTAYNPVYFIVSSPRDLILWGHLAEPNGFWASAGLCVLVFVVCLVAFHLTEARIAERV